MDPAPDPAPWRSFEPDQNIPPLPMGGAICVYPAAGQLRRAVMLQSLNLEGARNIRSTDNLMDDLSADDLQVRGFILGRDKFGEQLTAVGLGVNSEATHFKLAFREVMNFKKCENMWAKGEYNWAQDLTSSDPMQKVHEKTKGLSNANRIGALASAASGLAVGNGATESSRALWSKLRDLTCLARPSWDRGRALQEGQSAQAIQWFTESMFNGEAQPSKVFAVDCKTFTIGTGWSDQLTHADGIAPRSKAWYAAVQAGTPYPDTLWVLQNTEKFRSAISDLSIARTSVPGMDRAAKLIEASLMDRAKKLIEALHGDHDGLLSRRFLLACEQDGGLTAMGISVDPSCTHYKVASLKMTDRDNIGICEWKAELDSAEDIDPSESECLEEQDIAGTVASAVLCNPSSCRLDEAGNPDAFWRDMLTITCLARKSAEDLDGTRDNFPSHEASKWVIKALIVGSGKPHPRYSCTLLHQYH